MLSPMPRPRAFDEDTVVAAAKDLFWERGYLTTSVDELEEATGLGRSSLYGAFGTKRDLFEAALRMYLETFIDPLLSPLERDDAGLREVVAYFVIVGRLFREPGAQRGCLMLNIIGEKAGRDPGFTREGELFLGRIRSAFANALSGSVRTGVMSPAQATERAALLAGTVVGAWMTVRADPVAARALCRSAASQVESWGTGASAALP
jgi:AcrR family transcriptional regulator